MPTKIEWCDETINPLGHWCFGVGGTKDNPKPCPYCYAYKLAKRKMVKCEKCHSFKEPHTHFEVLDVLSKWKKPRNIFVQSMGDLFHNEVPDEWIQQVFEACEQAPQHRYFFLTKNPKRYDKVIPDKYRVIRGDKNCNMWFGHTETKPHNDVILTFNPPVKKFVSLEPLQEEYKEFYPNKMNWIIIGAETGNRKDKVIPEREWIEDIVDVCKRKKIPLFMKNNLKEIWGDELIQEFPFERSKDDTETA
ncbi:MAG: phage Gp37/Gp68 family protein [Candidatus Cloacimonetes bacterium]|nr:phage Gp37/Gp68 family protein [Candidatus Cloacimonadota bacterium]